MFTGRGSPLDRPYVEVAVVCGAAHTEIAAGSLPAGAPERLLCRQIQRDRCCCARPIAGTRVRFAEFASTNCDLLCPAGPFHLRETRSGIDTERPWANLGGVAAAKRWSPRRRVVLRTGAHRTMLSGETRRGICRCGRRSWCFCRSRVGGRGAPSRLRSRSGLLGRRGRALGAGERRQDDKRRGRRSCGYPTHQNGGLRDSVRASRRRLARAYLREGSFRPSQQGRRRSPRDYCSACGSPPSTRWVITWTPFSARSMLLR